MSKKKAKGNGGGIGGRHPTLGVFVHHLMECADMGDGVAGLLLEGARHPFKCRCLLCLQWWSIIGPEQDSHGARTWGPFSGVEIKRFQAGQTPPVEKGQVVPWVE